jgi:class 3 adenylate cyclase
MSQLVDNDLQAGREAIVRHAWKEAFDRLTAADPGELSGPDFESLAESAWWTGQFDQTFEFLERAFRVYQADGQPASAASVAISLWRNHWMRGNQSLSTGWLARAERLLADQPESVAHGHLANAQSELAIGEGRLDDGIRLAQTTVDIGARFGSRDLQAFGILMQGRALIARGDVPKGLALLDEATVAAVSGECSPFVSGLLYCIAIHTTQSMADYGRAGEWTDAATKWCQRQSIAGGFPGLCRVHRAEISRLRGSWNEAEQEAKLAVEELRDFSVPIAAEALYEIGEVRLRMGDLDAAQEAFRESHELGREPQPGLAMLQAARGDLDSAASSIRRALASETWDRLARGRLLPAQIEIAVTRRDLETARPAALELGEIAEAYGSTALRAAAASAEGAVLLAEGAPEAAEESIRRAWRLWQQIEAPYEAARARVMLAEASLRQGDQAGAKLEFEAAAVTFDRLGATLDAIRVDQLVAAAAEAVRTAPAERAVRTFMFTDIVRSTPLIEAIGDDAWQDLLRWHDEKLRRLFAAHEGEEIVHTGDGFFVAFAGAVPAFECAIAVQRELAEHRRAHGFSPQVRIGLHAGEAVKVGGNYTGKGVNQAARIGALAEGGEILASSQTAALPEKAFEVSEPRTVTLKGIGEPIDLVTVAWR